MKKLFFGAVAALLLLVTGCSSGGSGGCNVKGGTDLAAPTTFSWPKFRADKLNTGRSDADLHGSTGDGRLIFPPAGESIGAIATTPILGTASVCSISGRSCASRPCDAEDGSCMEEDRIFLGSTDGDVYVLNRNGERAQVAQADSNGNLVRDDDGNLIIQDVEINNQSAITSSPLYTEDQTLFIGAGNGTLAQYMTDGTLVRVSTVGGFISASPNIGSDGTVYVTSQAGVFIGICANGAARFSLAVTSSQSSVAVIDQDDDRTIIAGGDSGQVRAVDIQGRELWSFFASAPVLAAPVVDQAGDQVFVADSAGRVFAVDVEDGQSRDFLFQAGSTISASPALGRDGEGSVLYVAAEDGALYALDRDTGDVVWRFDAEGTIRSSPLVATGGDDDIVVFGTDDGLVYAVEDVDDSGGSRTPQVLWIFDSGLPIGQASPAIAEDGTIYIGAQGSGTTGALFAIG
jgi:outer membrane protein assembly factor BamB